MMMGTWCFRDRQTAVGLTLSVYFHGGCWLQFDGGPRQRFSLPEGLYEFDLYPNSRIRERLALNLACLIFHEALERGELVRKNVLGMRRGSVDLVQRTIWVYTPQESAHA